MSEPNEIHLAKGQRLQNGKYRLEKKIGQGGFGITYLARWYMQVSGAMGEASSYSIVVIKEFYWSEYCNREGDGKTVSISSSTGKELFAQFKEKLKKEGKLLSKFKHPNIVSILDIFEENNTAYLVMQYIEGDCLKDVVVKNGFLDQQKALKYTIQLCDALTEVHREKILHLDIKPSNVIIDEDDNAQLIDFGVSKQYSSETTGAMSETPFGISRGYSPMEQYSGISKFSPAADVYALGATLYYLLTGKAPLEATLRITEDLTPANIYNSRLSDWLCKAMEKAMEIKPKDRFQVISEFGDTLKEGMKIAESRGIEDAIADTKKTMEAALQESEKKIHSLQGKVSNLSKENIELKKQFETRPKSGWSWIVAAVVCGLLAIGLFIAYVSKSTDIDVSAYQTTISMLEAEIVSMQKEKDALQGKIKSAETEIASLKTGSRYSASTSAAELAQRDIKIADLQQEVDHLQLEIKQKDKQIQGLEKTIKEL